MRRSRFLYEDCNYRFTFCPANPDTDVSPEHTHSFYANLHNLSIHSSQNIAKNTKQLHQNKVRREYVREV